MARDADTLPATQGSTVAFGSSGTPAHAPTLPSTDLVGRVLSDRYRVSGRLGEGGMGTVYLAELIDGGAQVAIKVLSAEFCHKQEAIDRFMREAKTAARISHPNVVEISDVGFVSPTQPFFAMEKLEGEELGDLIARSGPLPWPRVREIMLQMLAALGAAHAVGVVHRDVKPQNCFLVPVPGGGELVKVLDFGIAKVISDDPELKTKTLTQTGAVMGSVHYMSPEQARSERVDERSDIYSAGVVAYKLLTGEVPYDASGVMGVLTKVLTEDYPPMASMAPHIPVDPRVEALVRRAMAKQREDRFSSAAAFSAALRQLPARLSGSSRASLAATLPASSPSARSSASGRPRGASPAELSAMQVMSQPRLELAELPEQRTEGRRGGWRSLRWLVLAGLTLGAIAALRYLPELALLRARAEAVTQEVADDLAESIEAVAGGEGELAADDAEVERERYVSLTRAAAAAYELEFSLDDLRAPHPFAHPITPEQPQALAVGKQRREGDLSLRAVATRTEGKQHTLLELENLGERPVAYRVEVRGAGKSCRAPLNLGRDAIVLDPGERAQISVCPGRRKLELVDLRTLVVTPVGAALLRKLSPRALGLSAELGRGHRHGKIVRCSEQPDRRPAVAAGEYAWEDLVDFHARHDCDHYAWWPGYRRVQAQLDSLPLLDPSAPAMARPVP